MDLVLRLHEDVTVDKFVNHVEQVGRVGHRIIKNYYTVEQLQKKLVEPYLFGIRQRIDTSDKCEVRTFQQCRRKTDVQRISNVQLGKVSKRSDIDNQDMLIVGRNRYIV